MANVDLSIIIPARNNKAKNASIIKMIADETRDLDVEFIVIDMNSTDGGVLEALAFERQVLSIDPFHTVGVDGSVGDRHARIVLLNLVRLRERDRCGKTRSNKNGFCFHGAYCTTLRRKGVEISREK